MEKVQGADVTPDWDSFEKYTAAIDPFEKQLLELESPLADNEKSGVPTKDKVSALITFMGKWVADRQRLIGASTELEQDHYKDLFDQAQALNAAANIKRALNEDDKQVLQELSDGIKNHGLKDSDISGSSEKLVTAVKEKVQEILAATSGLTLNDYERMGKIVHAVMAIFIPFLAHEQDLENAHIVSKEVWEAAKTFAEETKEFAQDSSIESKDFDKQWATYEKILLGEVGAFAMQMVSLMRQAALVRRPFFGRTVGIVRMWQALSDSTKLRDEKLRSARVRIQTLLTDTLAQFKQTHDEVKSFDKGLQATVEARQESYTGLVKRLQDEIKTYNAGEWDNVLKGYKKGADVDDEHLKKYHAFIEANKRAASLIAQVRA
ncbi:hypothetical protein H1R20_g16174, partial [Candolleomyces eurysporus]